MSERFTDDVVAGLRCPEGKKDKLFADKDLKGFMVRVAASGKKTFLFQYNEASSANGKRRVPLGVFGTELTTVKARKKAEVLRGQTRDGRDVVAERKRAKAEAAAAVASAAFTVEALIDDWAAQHLASRSASYSKRAPRDLKLALAAWLKAPAMTLARTDAVVVLDGVKVDSGPVQANRVRAEARACWTWAVKRGALEANPWADTPRPLAREIARERVLTDAEVGTLYRAADGLGEPWTALVKVLLLTGQRRSEVAAMRWSELDLDAGVWTLPGERAKNHQTHVVPLVPEVLELLRAIKRRRDAVYVFEGPRQTAVSGFGKLAARLDQALRKAALEEAEEAGRPVREPAQWTLHDMRRTLATGLQRLGVRLEVTEAVLNHVGGSRKGIVGVYQRYGWDSEKRAALEAWTKHVIALAENKRPASNVLPLRREAVA